MWTAPMYKNVVWTVEYIVLRPVPLFGDNSGSTLDEFLL